MIPGSPFNISSVFHPAMAIYSSACPACSAVNWVVSPISFARAFSFFMSASDAWEIACTVLIWLSYPMPMVAAAPKAAVIPAAAIFPPVSTAPKALSEIDASASIPFPLMPPNEFSISSFDNFAFWASLSICFWASLIDAARDASVPPEIMISSS